MTENPIVPFPASPYCQVRARVASIWADGPDDGAHPDWRPAVGEKVVLTPSIGANLLVYDVDGTAPIIVTVERVDCVVGADGFLTKSDGRPVYIAPTDDPLLSATGWTWTAVVKGKSITFSAPTGSTVDLALFVTTPAVPTTPTPSGGGSGVELVSGTVTLGPSGAPIREFYTTAAATISGVAFGAGTAVVFRRAPGGQWGYKVVEDWTPVGTTPDPDPGTNPDPELITVTATAPTWTDNATDGGGTWTTPSIAGVSYSPASGTAMPWQTVTVTATAQAGYVLSGPSSWSHSFPAAPFEAFTLAHTQGFPNPANTGGGTIFTGESVAQLGNPTPSRRIIVVTVGRKAAPSVAASGVTVAGVAATKLAEVLDNGTTTSIWAAYVPDGASGTVVSTWPESMVRCHMHVYRVTGSATAIVDSAQATGNVTANLDLTTADGGGIIAASVSTTGSATATWTGGVTEDAIIGPTMRVSSASGLTTGTSTPVGVSWTSNGQAHLAIALAPA